MVLSISSKSLECGEIIRLLQKSNINCDVTSNITIIDGNIENGCKLMKTINSRQDVQKVWNTVKNATDIYCGHLLIDGQYSGCILDYNIKSNCK